MTIAALVGFWLLPVLPGFVLVRRFFPRETEAGALATLALSSVTGWMALLPITIVCYVLELPLGIHTGAIVLAATGAVIHGLRSGLFPAPRDLVPTRGFVAGASVSALAISAFIYGALPIGDARTHIARVRWLLDHGMSNIDPFVGGDSFWPIYHTNFLHSFLASAAQLTGQDVLDVWRYSLPFVILLIAGGMSFLGHAVTGSRRAGHAAAMVMLVLSASVDFLIYPNKLTPFVLWPIIFGFVIRAVQDGAPPAALVRLALMSLLIGSIHGLYAAFAAALAVPILVGIGVYRLYRKRPHAVGMFIAAVAVSLGLIFPVISQRKTVRENAPLETYGANKATVHRILTRKKIQHSEAAERKRSNRSRQFVDGTWGTHRAFPRIYKGAARGLAVLIGIAAVMMLGTRRRSAAAFLGLAALSFAILYVPPICGRALETLGREWMLLRLVRFEDIVYSVFCGGAIALGLARISKAWWMEAAGTVAIIIMALYLANPNQRSVDNWKKWYERLRDPAVTEVGYEKFRDLRMLLEEHVPKGAVVAARPLRGMDVPMLYDARIIIAGQTSIGVVDRRQRLFELDILFHPQLPESVRTEILNKYDVDWVLISGNQMYDVLQPRVLEHHADKVKGQKARCLLVKVRR